MPADTRQQILDSALRLFAERGYAGTTMRAIAAAAGVSTGNAYYWFQDKDALVQEFYQQIQLEHRQRAGSVLAAGGSLADRLRAVEHAGLDVMTPFHSFGGSFVGTAILPTSSANPFSTESSPARELSTEIYRAVVGGADPAVPAKIRDELPRLLWLCHLGITLFWVTDPSENQQRTRDLVDVGTPMLAAMVKLARVPMTSAVVAQLGRLLDVVVPHPAPSDGSAS